LYKFASNHAPKLTELRERLRKMNDAELGRFGKAASYMCSQEASVDSQPRQSFLIQLEEAKAEWKRRKPDILLRDST
jgi:hypothetical protein